MATSGSSSVGVTSWDTLKFSWWRTGTSIDRNESYISWKVELISTAYGAIYSTPAKAWSVNVNGNSYSGTVSVAIGNNTTKTLASGSTTIPHNADGTKTFSYSFNQTFDITFSNTWIGTKSGSGSDTLDSIPRAATLTAAPDFNDEQNPTISYSNPAGNAVSSLQACISFTGAKDDITYRDISKTGSSYTFNLTDAERKVLRQNTTTSNSRTVRFYVKSIIGGTTYYSTLDKTLSIINATPTLSPSVIDVGSVSKTYTGDNTKMIKGFNAMQVATGAAAKKEATITSQSITCGGTTITAATGKFNYVDTNVFVFKATDSRGNTVSQTITVPMVEYIPLTCNVDGKVHLIADDSTKINLEFTVSGNYFNGSFGAVDNTLELSYTIEDSSGGISYETLTVPASAFSNNTYTVKKTLTNLNYKNSYIVIAQASDKINKNVKSTSKTLKALPVFDWGEDDFNFNVPVIFNKGFSGTSKVLWSSSGWYMNESQTANLSEAISAQPNGIVLVFSLYRNGAAEDVSINSFFVSKKEVELLPGAPHTFFMMINSGFSAIGAKYLYISDTSITGHDTNSTSGTNNGLNFNNTMFVLRYVIGV